MAVEIRALRRERLQQAHERVGNTMQNELMSQWKEIEFSTWKRREYFYYFTKMNPTAYSVTVQIEVTKLYSFIKKQDWLFFPSYLFIVTRLLTEYPEFKVGKVEDKLVEYEVLHPSYSLFHEEDQSISMMWTTFQSNFSDFYQSYLNDKEDYQDKYGTVVKKQPAPANTYMIGMIPWLEFTNYTPLPLEGLSSFFPVIQGGKMSEKNGKRYLPISFTIHHAVADGYHVSKFFNELQEAFNEPQKWLIKE